MREARQTDTWRLVVDPGATGAQNMARDEAVAMLIGSDDPPTLRAYRFEPPAVTLGRFQPLDTIDAPACRASGVEMVRRPTGGLAILHSGDFTYSFVMRAGDRHQDRARCFDIVASGIIAALRTLGVEARQVSHKGRGSARGWCFEGAYGVDLEWEGRKICGSAQRVYPHSVLQHGSLFLEPAEELFSSIDAAGNGNMHGALVTVREAAGWPVAWEEMLDSFCRGFASAHDVTLAPGRLHEEELEAAMCIEESFRLR